MDIERFIAALAPDGRSSDALRSRCATWRTTRAPLTAGLALLLRPGQPCRRARVRGGGRRRTAPWRSSSSDRSSSTCRNSSSPIRARAMAVAADEFFERPDRGARGRGRHRHERQDDDRLPALLDPRRGRTAAWSARDDREPRRRRARGRPCGRRPRRSTCSGRSARCSTAAIASCAMEATSHGSELGRLDRVRFVALVFTNLTPGPPRLPRHDGALLRRRSAGSSPRRRPPAAVNLGDAHGRRLAEELEAGQRRC